MTLETLLKKLGKKESDIIEYKGEGALKAIESDVCALRYLDKSVFEK